MDLGGNMLGKQSSSGDVSHAKRLRGAADVEDVIQKE